MPKKLNYQDINDPNQLTKQADANLAKPQTKENFTDSDANKIRNFINFKLDVNLKENTDWKWAAEKDFPAIKDLITKGEMAHISFKDGSSVLGKVKINLTKIVINGIYFQANEDDQYGILTLTNGATNNDYTKTFEEKSLNIIDVIYKGQKFYFSETKTDTMFENTDLFEKEIIEIITEDDESKIIITYTAKNDLNVKNKTINMIFDPKILFSRNSEKITSNDQTQTVKADLGYGYQGKFTIGEKAKGEIEIGKTAVGSISKLFAGNGEDNKFIRFDEIVSFKDEIPILKDSVYQSVKKQLVQNTDFSTAQEFIDLVKEGDFISVSLASGNDFYGKVAAISSDKMEFHGSFTNKSTNFHDWGDFTLTFNDWKVESGQLNFSFNGGDDTTRIFNSKENYSTLGVSDTDNNLLTMHTRNNKAFFSWNQLNVTKTLNLDDIVSTDDLVKYYDKDEIDEKKPIWNKGITTFDDFKELMNFVEDNKWSNLYIKLNDGEIISGIYVNADTDNDPQLAWIKFNGISTKDYSNQGIGNFKISWDSTNNVIKYTDFDLSNNNQKQDIGYNSDAIVNFGSSKNNNSVLWSKDGSIPINQVYAMGNIIVITSITADGKNYNIKRLRNINKIYGKEYIDDLEEKITNKLEEEIANLKALIPPVEIHTNDLYANSLRTEINDNEFQSKNFKQVYIPNVRTIGNQAFYTSTLTELSLPNATTIEDGAFFDSQLTTLSIPNATTIGDYAFFDSQLTTLSIPNATTIGNGAFYTSTLTELSLPNATTIEDGAFYTSTLTELSLPNATTIGNDAFYSSQLTTLSIPNATTIGDYAFFDSQLTTLSIPNATTIGNGAFYTSTLTELSLPNATTIEDGAFYTSTLTELSLPNATTIGEDAFKKIINSSSTKVKIKSQFNTTTEKDKIFGNNHWDKIDFEWV